ncbi:SGNH/GDSL hydrolase family protein [Zobellia galactanivorans]|uniref:SGNH/GDSL hydrolase family protein n=1 Tax=Zobellia galactanivorans (strain DSM 12802 / CCUG 47099 / CIP 106680 / NCIMB 13871 / Dsij) TaxID=63186 RepID=UPI0026E45DA5|nr:SGNH/GDSL hydrolase family protein [Zobellia galactanivorans]MDO6811309.1 SGNH/GDSL hydrolase family protein [Zobellia galactanivorans]
MNSLRKNIVIVLLALLIQILYACNRPDTKPLNVLLVGNSSIYYNNMPKMLEYIAHENGKEIRTKLIAFGGYTLQDHLRDGIVEKMLDSLNWDFVILNEQSTLGENYVVDGVRRVKESESFYESVRKFDSIIKKRGAKTVILSLYSRKNAPKIDGEILDYSYMKIARELGIQLSPVSYTWQDILKIRNNWQLYREDNLHPTPLGSYVTANVIYSTLTENKSKSLNGEINGPVIEEFDGNTYQDSIVCLIKIDESKSQIVSEKAYNNVLSLNESGGYFKLKKPD